ncbi:MAG: universal stress protein [Natrialbaceae archaeon]|nr:universal stress protein [Natrialbaceae archaeon]
MRALIATDLSHATRTMVSSRRTLDSLQAIGVETIHLVTVINTDEATIPGLAVEDKRRVAIDRQEAALIDAGFDVDVHALRGTPHQRINDVAESEDVDLILMGSQTERPFEARPIGRTARNMARSTVAPLLICRLTVDDDEVSMRHDRPFERILYATDFSDNANLAFDELRELEPAVDTSHLLHVSGSDESPSEDATDRLEALASELGEAGIGTSIAVEHGDPAEEILAAADAFDPTCILVGSRGQGRLRRLLLGSVSGHVAIHSETNVLIVPPSRR